LTASELRRKLARIGCTFEEGSRRAVIFYKGNRSLMPRHPKKEIKSGTYHGILNKPGIKESEL
jgi:predicted RNA binding protein YcfA (HicA-like mRNA interferase family)